MWTLIQVVFDIFAALGFFVIIMRMNRAPKDDPRLSRGLQLLQSKISVLEDLSDRTETQANQLSAILEQKCKEVQAKVQIAEQHIHEIRVSMDRSLEVAKIFQDKIPHQEIIERQNTLKYVQAARLAHQGVSAEEIATQIDLPKTEVDFIAKVNREQLMFNEDQLPEWARGPAPESLSPNFAQAQPMPAIIEDEQTRLVENLSRLQDEMRNLDNQIARDAHDLTGAFDAPLVEAGSLQRLGDEFRKACEDAEKENSRPSALPPLEQLTSLIPHIFAHEPAAPVEPPPPPIDPEVARANAIAKVQAALAQGRANEKAAMDELNLARAAAQASQEPPIPNQVASPAPLKAATASTSPPAPVIRKVQFPRIDSPVK